LLAGGYTYLNTNCKISISAKQESIKNILDRIQNTTGINYSIEGGHIILSHNNDASTPRTQQEERKISGTVVDNAGEPIIGANVVVKGSTNGTTTDINGNFSLFASSDAILSITYIGYNSKDVAIENQSIIKIILSEDTQTLEEVVVIGYGTMRKSDVTGSVSSINSDDFNVGVITSPTDMMQGRMSGVNITMNGGEPGAGSSIRIRGSNSIRSGQEPLYVIDGIPLETNNSQPSGASIAGVGNSGNKNPLNFLNPNDIESIDVLKDASATAIYGSRGANGVILITTKKGKTGAPTVSYSGYMAISSIPKKLEVLNASEFKELMNKNNISYNDMGATTNWQDEIFRTALSHNHSLSLGGGGEDTQYRVSLSYMNQEGIIKKSNIEKYTGRMAFNQSLFNNRIKLDGSITVARTNDIRIPLGETGGSEGDLLYSALTRNPTYPVYNKDGSYYQTTPTERNPVAMLNLTDDKTQTDRMLFNFSALANIIKGLDYKINIGLDEEKASRKVTQNQQLIYLSNGGTLDINNVEASSQLIEHLLTYNLMINRKHKLNIMAGMSYQRFKYYSYGLSEYGFDIEDINYGNELEFGNYTEVTVKSDITKNELQSFFSRVNYNLNDKYLVTATLRADGSTKFGDNNKYGYFPSMAIGWRLSEEEFLKNLSFLDNLKLRFGWGITGNQEIPNKISRESLGSTTGAIIDGSSNNVTPGISLIRTPNPDIKWEKNMQANIGFDFSVIDGRLSGSIDYFSKRTTDVLLQIYSISPAPTSQIWTNVPNMVITNKGIDLSLNSILIKNKDLFWDLGINYSKYKNMVKDCPMSQITSATASGPGILGNISQVIMNNHPIGTFWGKNFMGFDENGMSIYETDENGNEKNMIIGNANPKFTFNANTSLKYKNFDLSLFFNGVFGNDIYNNLANIIDTKAMFSKGYNILKSASNSSESVNNGLVVSNRYIEDGSYFRLSSATLGYSFNTQKINLIKNMRVFIAGNNLFTITKYSGYDPEINSDHTSNGVPSMGVAWTAYPKARTITFGLNIEF
jgi:TonB-linked SusC/RagA family outer membrane protein